jgi:hypothetical protein
LSRPDLPLPDKDKEKERKEKERAAKLAASTTWEPAAAPRPGGAKPAAEEKEPQAKVRILSEGKVIRTFEAPAKLGVNRAVWDLRRDAFKEFPRLEEPRPYEEEPKGPEVPPGSYEVVVSLGDAEARGTVTVLADPTASVDAEGWNRRWQWILALGALRDSAVDAVLRLRDARADIDAVIARVRSRAGRDVTPGERDDRLKQVDEDPLVKAGRALSERLTAVEKRLWAPPETVGIVAENDAVSKIFEAGWPTDGSWDPATPSDEARLALAKAKLAEVLAEVDALFAGDVAAFRRDADAAGVRLLAP